MKIYRISVGKKMSESNNIHVTSLSPSSYFSLFVSSIIQNLSINFHEILGKRRSWYKKQLLDAGCNMEPTAEKTVKLVCTMHDGAHITMRRHYRKHQYSLKLSI